MNYSSQKIADKLIATSRGILSRPSGPLAPPSQLSRPDCHVMTIEAYKARFGAATDTKE